MLGISFFITSFTSIAWLIYTVRYFSAQMNSAQAETDFLFHAAITITLPVMVIWGIFSLIKNYHSDRKTSHYAYHIFEQIQKNSNILNEINQTLLETQIAIKNNSMLQEFNLLISDINEILSDIIKRSNSISSAQLEHLCTRTSEGERWLLAKTFIEITNYQPEFTEHLKKKANKDSLLRGSILEFHARYKHISNLVKTNNGTIYNNMIEYGALGKVYEMLNPIVQFLQNEPLSTTNKNKPILKAPVVSKFSLSEESEPFSIPSFLSSSEDTKPALTIKSSANHIPPAANIDEGLRAIRDEILSPQKEEPKLKNNDSPSIMSGFTKTQIALKQVNRDNSTKEAKTEKRTPVISLDELEEEINNSQENNYDEYAYPFGAWLNDKKTQ